VRVHVHVKRIWVDAEPRTLVVSCLGNPQGELATGVTTCGMLPPMTKTQVYFAEADLEALHRVARRAKRPVAALVREAVREVWLRPSSDGPVGLWRGPIGRTSADHDSIYDEP
jgi:hypothetical protein